ncbi:MAG TPA: SRPBCC family protein [Gaiellaceae bacterium]
MTEGQIVGTLRVVDGKGVVHVEDVYATEIGDLWSALTDPARVARWLAEVEGDLRLGGTFGARFTSGWEGSGRIDVCEPPYRLLLTMSAALEDDTVIEAVLSAEVGGTRLVIEERGLAVEDLPGHGAGWQAHLEDLATYLSGGEPGTWRARWTELTPVYRELEVTVTGA